NAWFSEPTTTETAIPEPTNTLLPTLIPTSVQLVTRTQTGIPMAQTMGLMVTPIATQLPVSTPKPTSTLSASTQAPVQSAIALSASTPTPVQSAIALSTSTPTPTETLSCSRLVRFSSQGTNPDEKKIDIVLSEAPCSLPDGQLYEWRVWKCNSSDGCNDGYKNGSGLEDATESTKKIRNLISNGKTIEISIPNPDWAQGEYKLALVSGKLIINTKGKKDFFVIALLTEIIDVTIGGGSDGEANSAPNREKPQPK
ncbi:MAG: hypothetical protein KDD62_01790, partial [Bdellovibrionales bacterium]|nr:hypothetical protein [Bdellovibrionales bacterium]